MQAGMHADRHRHVCIYLAQAVIAYAFMAYTVMAYIVMTYVVMVYTVIVYTVMQSCQSRCRGR